MISLEIQKKNSKLFINWESTKNNELKIQCSFSTDVKCYHLQLNGKINSEFIYQSWFNFSEMCSDKTCETYTVVF